MPSTGWRFITSGAAGASPGGATRTPARAHWLGRVGYLEAARLQHRLAEERKRGEIPDTFLFLEHPPVITLGRASEDGNLLAPMSVLGARGVELFETTRGGDVTYHGPGQLVGYGIVDLREHGRDVGRYLRELEEALIRTLGEYGFTAGRRAGMTGAWVDERKVAAIGVRAEKWVTAHGFALNVDPDLGHFEWIVPCWIREYGVASIASLLRERDARARVPSLEEVAEVARKHLGEVFGLDLRMSEPGELDQLAVTDPAPLGGVKQLS